MWIIRTSKNQGDTCGSGSFDVKDIELYWGVENGRLKKRIFDMGSWPMTQEPMFWHLRLIAVLCCNSSLMFGHENSIQWMRRYWNILEILLRECEKAQEVAKFRNNFCTENPLLLGSIPQRKQEYTTFIKAIGTLYDCPLWAKNDSGNCYNEVGLSNIREDNGFQDCRLGDSP